MDQQIYEVQQTFKGQEVVKENMQEHLEGKDGSKDKWAEEDGEEGEGEGGENWESQWGASLIVPVSYISFWTDFKNKPFEQIYEAELHLN